MGLLDWLRGTPAIDGEYVLVLRDAKVAAMLTRPREPVWEAPAAEPCDKCGRSVGERIITTGGPGSEPAVWDEVPVVVDGWACVPCGVLRYPRPASPERITSFGKRGAELGGKGSFGEAEWWMVRMLWSWPHYAPAYLDLAQVLLGRVRSEQTLALSTKRRLQRRAREAYETAIDLETANPSELHARILSAAHLALAEMAIEERAEDVAERSIDACLSLPELDEAALARAHELQHFVRTRWWVYLDAAAVVGPYLKIQGRSNPPIADPETRQRVTKAVDALVAHHEFVPTKWQVLWTAAMGSAALGQQKRSLELWRTVWRAHPAVPDVVREFGLELLRQELNEEARDMNRDAVERLPDDATLWCNLAVTEVLTGDLAEARRCAHKSQELDPADPITRALCAMLAKLREGSLPKTLDELQRKKA